MKRSISRGRYSCVEVEDDAPNTPCEDEETEAIQGQANMEVQRDTNTLFSTANLGLVVAAIVVIAMIVVYSDINDAFAFKKNQRSPPFQVVPNPTDFVIRQGNSTPDPLNCSTYNGDVQLIWDSCHNATHFVQHYLYCDVDGVLHQQDDMDESDSVRACSEFSDKTLPLYCHTCRFGSICSSLPDLQSACMEAGQFPSSCQDDAISTGAGTTLYHHVTGCDGKDFVQEWRECSQAGSDSVVYSKTTCPSNSPCMKCADGVTIVCSEEPNGCGEHGQS